MSMLWRTYNSKKIMKITKYIKVDWPESQKFANYEECFLAISNNPVCSSGNTYMVPEDLYDKVINKLQFPKKYENTNLGTIVCYENYALVNGNEYFWYDLSNLEKENKVLVYNYNIPSGYNKPKWIITTCKACSKGLPIILEDAVCIPDINCEIVGHYNPEIPF